MKTKLLWSVVAVISALFVCSRWSAAQPAADPLVEGFRLVEVASVADAIEQLYGQRAHMSHQMRPLFMTKFAGPAKVAKGVEVLLSDSSWKNRERLRVQQYGKC